MTPLATGSTVQRTYLFVPPEEKSEVQALGACWDADSKRWYIDSGEPSTKYSRWLPATEHEEEFTITSTEAYVAAATTACKRLPFCHRGHLHPLRERHGLQRAPRPIYRLGCLGNQRLPGAAAWPMA